MTEENNKNTPEIPANPTKTESKSDAVQKQSLKTSSTNKPSASTQAKATTPKKATASTVTNPQHAAALESLRKEKEVLLKKIEILEASKAKSQEQIAELELRIKAIQEEKEALIQQNETNAKETSKTVKKLEKQLEKFLKSQSKKEKDDKEKKEKKDKKDKKKELKSKTKKEKKTESARV
ncbi:MAG: hypothetical protein NW226_05035 [Microscillaceae bacterium]|nr:hypothetical protein [Microscillaceae bacterium]